MCSSDLQPFFHNTLTRGHSWQDHKTRKSQVLGRQEVIRVNMPSLWPWVMQNVDNAVRRGWLIDG